MLRITMLVLLVSFRSISYADEMQKIEVEAKWYGDTYSVGEKEPGFWGFFREGDEVLALIKSDPDAYGELKKSRIVTYSSFAAVALYYNSLGYYESSNELLKDQLVVLPFLIASGFLVRHYQKKAVDTYNSGVDVHFGIAPKKASLSVVYRY
ncbi:MAG: hypothetical protein JKY01_12770 [Pseudomonadales bacterium]|nr:hypothetical protein [Pseudomonadales bacterium]